MAFHWFMLSINMPVFIETFSVVLYKFIAYDLMASGGKGGKGGKGDCSGQGKWPARDCRPEYGGPVSRPGSRVRLNPRSRKGPDCRICDDICCGVSRALISKAFDLDCITVSRKVSLG